MTPRPPPPTPGLPRSRCRIANDAPLRPERDFVLYWMITARRLEWNWALERAVGLARELDRPLLVFEALRAGHRWANHRLHRFCLDGMAEHRERLEDTRAGYFPYVEPRAGDASGLLVALADRAVAVVTDEFPSFFLPRMVAAAGERLDVRLEVVDGNGLVPLRAPGRDFSTAHSFRRHLHRSLPEQLGDAPTPHPLRGAPLSAFEGLPSEVVARWPPASATLLDGDDGALARLSIDPEVPPVSYRGGRTGAIERLECFLADRLDRYVDDRNHPDRDAPSGLSPYLHWGHISAHEIFDAVVEREEWHPGRLSERADGRRQGWWGMSAGAEAFLDQLVTWRELGFNTAWEMDAPEAWESLPGWAHATLDEHSADTRPHLYSLEQFEAAETHDPLWNAAQRQLRTEGIVHGYLRMLWGKKILEWTESPPEALRIMLHLNDRWAVDGRDPNSTSGIFWTLGRYDRGWPERTVYGTVRSMTSRSTRRKVDLDRYLERFGPQPSLAL